MGQYSFLQYRMKLGIPVRVSRITSMRSSRRNPKEKFWKERLSWEPTGLKMLVFMNLLWEWMGPRLWAVTLSCMYWKTETGRFLIITPPSCLKVLPTAITKDEVRDLFQLWNGALATLDSSEV